ncbi:MAG: prepilin-type N-terminal cleavage/methylation domain-containing protein [Desulfobacterales bacterium]|jgi:type IV pilus assembly protein PilW
MPNPKRLKAILAKFIKPQHAAAAEPAGFTLIELMVAMAVASIMLAAVVGLFTTLNKSYTRQNVAANIQQVARAGVDFMAQSIRMAGLDPDQTGDFRITAATETSITFRADLDLDGSVAGTGETISYFLNGQDLMSNLNPTVPLVENVTDLTFTYLAADDSILAAPVADPAAIRTVQIALTVEEPAGRGGTVTRTYATEVRCRNLGI